jgi:ABC-2 type transport system permease protein
VTERETTPNEQELREPRRRRAPISKRLGEAFRRQVLDNPVVHKELRGRMRGRRAFVVLTIYLLLLSCLTSTIYLAYASAAQQPYGPDSYLIGKIVFGGVLGVQVMLVIFITPAFTAGTISGERERQTYDLLRTTLLPARDLVTGKLVAALSYVVLLILAAVPLESLAFLLGGVAWEEIIVSQLILLVTALAVGAASTYFSSRMKSTLSATVVSYAFALLCTAGLPILLSMLAPILGFATTAFMEEPHWLVIAALIYVGGFLLSTNPIATIILSEVVLIEEQTLFFFKVSFPATSAPVADIWLISPWVVYVLSYLLVALLAYRLTVRRVRRTEQ